MTDLERAEARALEPSIGREVGQTFLLMALLAGALGTLLGMGFLAAWLLG